MVLNFIEARCVKTRAALSSSTAVLALMLVVPGAAQAQEASVETVTVSASRIQSAGFTAPTPTTVISGDDLVKQGNTNVFTTITQLPSLMGSTGTSVGNGGSSNGVNGLSTLNLRNLGTNRNLILIDGERVVPASSIGVSDISQFPQLLIQRVDVVTGGASASWGSDAVSGVINFILDKKFEGFKANISGAITDYADDPHAQVQVAAGTSFAGGRAHIEVSGEFTSEAGVDSVTGPRHWWKNPQQLQMYSTAQCRPNGCPGGSPQNIYVFNGKLAQWAYGGLITRGPLQGTQFGAGGTPSQFDYGYGYNGQPAIPARDGTNKIIGCSSGGYCVGGDTTGNQTGYAAMVARLVRGNAFARVSYDLTPAIEIYATGMYSEVVTWDKPTQNFFKNDNLQIGCDNPFLPASVAAACSSYAGPGGAYAPSATDLANGPGGAPVNNGFVNGFTNGKMQYGALNSQLKSVENFNNRTLRRFVVGSDGVFNLFDTDWSFKGYFQHGETGYYNSLENQLITPFYNAAIDAVTVTAANQASFPGVPLGSVICRSAAARSVGCQPLNIIGTDGASDAARTFVQGLGRDGVGSGAHGRVPWQRVSQRQEVLDFGVSGEPFENWAGKVSVATGFQYREEAFNTVTDCASRGNCANETFDGVTYGPAGNPLLNPSAGPGLPPYSPNWYAGNFQPASGNFHESEVFLETNVPVLNDDALGVVNLNVAGRYTHYSTSGDVETWKVGFTWDTPLDGLRVRGLQSRDVRAPNLAELYAGARVNNGSVTDRFSLNGVPNQSISPVTNPITSNPNLKPEKGQTTELGLVWSPSYIPGLNLSATYYRIAVKGIITQLGQQQQMDLCFNGNAQQCALINTNGTPWAVNGVIDAAAVLTRPTSQTTPAINLASTLTSGVDYEASYQFAVDDVIDWGLGGNVTLRMLTTNVMDYVTNSGLPGAALSESAGSNSGSVPHWKVFLTQAYDADNWGLFVNERGFSEGVINRNWVACTANCPAPVDSNHPTVNTNYMPGDILFDIGGHYDATPHTSLWFKIDNLTNQNPGNILVGGPSNQGPGGLNPGLYDVLGRFYHVGIRITQ
jgi:outer membrane receptor protein involved in Fe transport